VFASVSGCYFNTGIKSTLPPHSSTSVRSNAHQVQKRTAHQASKQHAVVCMQMFYRKYQAQAFAGQLKYLEERKQVEAATLCQTLWRRKEAQSCVKQLKARHSQKLQFDRPIKLGAWCGPTAYAELSPLFQALWRQKMDDEKATRATLQALTKEQRQLARKVAKAEVHKITSSVLFPPPSPPPPPSS
jgi:hypothetical protein